MSKLKHIALALVAVFSVSTHPVSVAQAQSPTLTGDVVQGGIIRGKLPPQSQVWLNGQALPITPSGEFIFGIAKDANEPITVSYQYPNGDRDTQIITPQVREFQIQRINGLPSEQVTPPQDVLERIREEAMLAKSARDRISPLIGFTEAFIWPADGPITGVYGSQRILNGEPRAPHWGVDVAAPVGTPVVAPASGEVVLAHQDMYFSGGTLFIDHGHGLMSAFLHLDSLSVEVGAHVQKGQLIATVGQSGRATGPHLDWRVSWRDLRVDAQLLVPPR